MLIHPDAGHAARLPLSSLRCSWRDGQRDQHPHQSAAVHLFFFRARSWGTHPKNRASKNVTKWGVPAAVGIPTFALPLASKAESICNNMHHRQVAKQYICWQNMLAYSSGASFGALPVLARIPLKTRHHLKNAGYIA